MFNTHHWDFNLSDAVVGNLGLNALLMQITRG